MGKRVNTTVKERKALLKELGYTEEDMQRFYDEAAEVNSKIQMLVKAGINWTQLTQYQMRQLPGLKERTLEQLAEQKKQEEAEHEAKKQKQSEKEYYNEHFEEIMLDKIEKGEKLTEKELNTLVSEYEHARKESSQVYKNMRDVETIVKLGDKYFCINWTEDLGDWGEHMFSKQPYEVKLVERVIKVEEWRRVE